MELFRRLSSDESERDIFYLMASLISTSHDINFAKLVAFSSKSLIDGSSSSQASTLSLRTGINSKRHQHSSPDIVPACRAPLHAHGNVDGQHLGALDLSILDPVYIGGTNAAAHGPIIALIHSFTFPFSLARTQSPCCSLTPAVVCAPPLFLALILQLPSSLSPGACAAQR